ncbi:c-type cytochrome [Ramlibacter algicola]|uniref:Cytochrome c4 n=1 Tax=Ramlibacter algicola TaxID=2795217 RepID=A0A934PZY1_9BURK|nr:c-type cytochrome [Ramlibacter algicola]MBK0391754.1 cytochrome c4 [Ramlibacter algicola]
MNKLLSTLLALFVASATNFAHAQATPAAPQAPQSQAPGNAPAGPASLQAKIAMCLGCHNIIGYQASFPEVHKVPMIAGQNAGYIEAALHAYKGGERKHPTMRGIADALSDQDIKDIAAYYSKLGLEGGTKLADKPGDEPSPQVAALLQKANCVSCHGANFSKPIAPNYPKIGGQHADYLFVALKQYKTDNNAAVGRNNAIMGAIAKQFSNAELKSIAQYLGSIQGDVKTVPESRFHKHE